MNYFEHHIGDYLRDTAHLSLLEHGVYRRLLDVYYTREEPLPADCGRLIGARSRDEKAALKAVLEEFFEPAGEGWCHKRCDAEIAKFHEAEPEREARRENDRERQRRSRERRRALFDALRELDIVPPFDTKTADLEATLSRAQKRDVSQDVTPPVTRDNTATHTQYPYPVPKNQDKGAHPDATTSRALAEGTVEPESPVEGAGTRYGLVARAMRLKGCAATPGDPRLRQLVDQGASIEEFEAVGAEAANKGKGPAWALTALINRRKEAEQVRLAPAAAPPPWHETRDGVSARGQELGLGAWQDFERASMAKGISPRYDAYRNCVIEADQARQPQETTR